MLLIHSQNQIVAIMSELERLDNNLDSITRSLDEIDGLLQPLFGEQNIDKLAETISLG